MHGKYSPKSILHIVYMQSMRWGTLGCISIIEGMMEKKDLCMDKAMRKVRHIRLLYPLI